MLTGNSDGGQLKHYKDSLKKTLTVCDIPPPDLESLAMGRAVWRTMCLDAVSRSEERRLDALKEKRAQRKDGPPVSSNFQCDTCGRMCRSRIGLFAHTRTHRSWWDPSCTWRLSPDCFTLFYAASYVDYVWRLCLSTMLIILIENLHRLRLSTTQLVRSVRRKVSVFSV